MNKEEKEKKLNTLVNEKYSNLSNQEKLDIAKKKKKAVLYTYNVSIVLILLFFILPYIILSIVEMTSQYIIMIVIAVIIEIVLIVFYVKNKKRDDESFCKRALKKSLSSEMKNPNISISEDLRKMGFYVSKEINVNDRKLSGYYSTLFIDNINKKFVILNEEYQCAKLKNKKLFQSL